MFFLLVEYDPNPLLLLIGKRRRHTTNESVDTISRKSTTISISESGQKIKRGPGRPPKIKREESNVDGSDDEEEEEEEVDVCGIDDENDDVFSSGFSNENAKRDRSKSTSKKVSEKRKIRRIYSDEESDSNDEKTPKKKTKDDNTSAPEQG